MYNMHVLVCKHVSWHVSNSTVVHAHTTAMAPSRIFSLVTFADHVKIQKYYTCKRYVSLTRGGAPPADTLLGVNLINKADRRSCMEERQNQILDTLRTLRMRFVSARICMV